MQTMERQADKKVTPGLQEDTTTAQQAYTNDCPCSKPSPAFTSHGVTTEWVRGVTMHVSALDGGTKTVDCSA